MRSFDQFCNFALEDAIERRFCTDSKSSKTYYSDISLGGVFLVRGDSVMVLGEYTVGDLSKNLEEVNLESLESIIEEQKRNDVNNSELDWDMD